MLDKRTIIDEFLKADDIEMIAKVNHLDNFILWGSTIVFDLIVTSYGDFNDYKDNNAIEEFDKFVDSCTKKVPYYGNMAGCGKILKYDSYTVPYQCPLIREVCTFVYHTIRNRE